MNKKLLFLLASLALSTMVCVFPNLDTGYFAVSQPALTELAGKYVPTKETWDYIRNEGHYEATEISIVLSSDLSLEMKNMPDWWTNDFGKSDGKLDSLKGTWSVVKRQEWWELGLDFPSLTTSVPIVGKQPPYTLWFYIGDPDEGHVMIFEKVSE